MTDAERYAFPAGAELFVMKGDEAWTGMVLARYEQDGITHDVRLPGSWKRPRVIGKVANAGPGFVEVTWLDDGVDCAGD